MKHWINIIDTKEFDRNDMKSLFISKKIYRVDSKIIISDKHLKQLVEIIGFMPDKFSVKDFKDKSNLSRKYAIPYLELLDKIGITQKLIRQGLEKNFRKILSFVFFRLRLTLPRFQKVLQSL